MAGRYFLCRDIHVCASSGEAVFLNLDSGRYLTLPERAARLLSRHVVGWPVPSDAMALNAASDDARRLLSQLVQKGLLTTEAHAGKRVNSVNVATPECTLLDSIYLREPPIRARHIAAFLLCAYRARLLLRGFGIKAVLERVRRRKVDIPEDHGAARLEQTRMLTAIFTRLQPLGLDGRDGCLLHSFALLEFLMHHGLTAQWVFGVRAVPFTAHCWLQQAGVVINDYPQRAGYLSPILTV